jgi:hypothetical protein
MAAESIAGDPESGPAAPRGTVTPAAGALLRLAPGAHDSPEGRRESR